MVFPSPPSLMETSFSFAESDLTALCLGDVAQAEMCLLFLHGWLDNAASFERVMTTFAAQHAVSWQPDKHCFCDATGQTIALVAIDLPGHGLSTHTSADHFYPFHDYMDIVHQLRTTYLPAHCLMVGHSLGGLIAICYSAAFPEYVDGLCLIEAVSPLSEPPSCAVERLRKGVLSRMRQRKKPLRYYASFEQACRHRAEVSALDIELITPMVKRGLMSVVNDHGETHWHWRYDPALHCQSLYRMTEAHARTLMQHVQCPVQILLGKMGYPSLQNQEIYSLFQQAEVSFADGHHHCHIEYPEHVMSLLGRLFTMSHAI